MRDAPAVPEVWLAPKLAPEMILMLTVARAVMLLTGWNDDALPEVGGADAGTGETLAANRISGAIMSRLITQCARHG